MRPLTAPGSSPILADFARRIEQWFRDYDKMPKKLPAVNVADLTGVYAAANWTDHSVIVPDETGGRTICTSDGSSWKRVSDGATAS